MRRILFIGVVVFVTLIVSSCQFSDHVPSKNAPSKKLTKVLEKTSSDTFFEKKQIQPLSLEKQNFSSVSEWLDNENILYINGSSEKQSIYRYNIYTGKSKIFYSSETPIVSVSANQDHSYFFVRTAPSTYEAGIIVLNKMGKEVFNWKVGSYDLLVTWNPYVRDELYVTTFLADWSFQTYIIDANKKAVTKNHLLIPFIQWIDRHDIAYLKWNENEPGFSAPLYEVNLKLKKEERVFENISFFSAFPDTLLTVKAENKTNAKYSFYKLNLKDKLGEFSTPILAKYSEWFIPESDFVEKMHLFYTFRPYESGDYDEYKQKFDLISYSYQSGQEKVVLANIDHKPIKFSPNGQLCLYGYYFENMIDIHSKKIIPLILLR